MSKHPSVDKGRSISVSGHPFGGAIMTSTFRIEQLQSVVLSYRPKDSRTSTTRAGNPWSTRRGAADSSGRSEQAVTCRQGRTQ